uniref:Putative secreted protein n=1 Tax=Ixodes ricinus TaxID=34613 RepID=A0A6B0U7H0_IXORI
MESFIAGVGFPKCWNIVVVILFLFAFEIYSDPSLYVLQTMHFLPHTVSRCHSTALIREINYEAQHTQTLNSLCFTISVQ